MRTVAYRTVEGNNETIENLKTQLNNPAYNIAGTFFSENISNLQGGISSREEYTRRQFELISNLNRKMEDLDNEVAQLQVDFA